MQKYQFTGHLTPLPPGINLPLQISGEVFLVPDVEQHVASLQREIQQARKFSQTLSRSNDRLRKKIDKLKS